MKIINIYIIGILLLILPSVLRAQSLQDYLSIAAENNPGLKAKYAEFEAALQRVAQVNSLPDPILTFGYFVAPVETRVGPQQAKVGLSQMFPWIGTLSAKENSAKLMAEAKYKEFLFARNRLYYNVKAAWYPLYELKRTIDLQIKNRNILNSFKQLSTTSFRNGNGSMVDVIRVDIMLDQVDVEIQLLREKIKPLHARFNLLLNRSDTVNVLVPDSIPLVSLSKGYRKDSLLNGHPILEALELKMQSVTYREQIARKMAKPSFGFGIDYVFVDERSDIDLPDNGNDVVMPMVTLSLPIYSRKYRAASKEAQFDHLALSHRMQEYQNELITSYELAWYELDRSIRLTVLYKEQIEKTKQAIDLILVAYRNSGEDFEEVLMLQQQLLTFQIAESKSVSEFYTALAEIDFLTAKTE